jgi:acetyltransferase-like isoleucine patch superfamily enzyme
MSEMLPIQISQEFVNDETVKLLRWYVDNEQEVQEGNTVAEIETSKAVVELAAAATGKVLQRTKAGQEVRVGEIVGFIFSINGANGKTVEVPAGDGFAAQGGTKYEGATDNFPPETQFSKKALLMLTEHGLSSDTFAGRGLIRERDVLSHLQRIEEVSHNLPIERENLKLGGVSLPAGCRASAEGELRREFLQSLRADAEQFAKLSSADKCDAYRAHGAIVGTGVVLEEGAIVIAPQIVIGDGVRLGVNSFVQCREKFVAGQLTSFRTGLSVRGGSVVMGENVFGGARVQVGGGGHGDPESALWIGDGTYIGDDVFVNICRPVIIGREVFLTQRSIIVTHNIGHSVLEGYENRFAPVVLEDYSQVGMNSVIYAGTRIGCGSIVMSNSYVISSIPAGKLAAGVPARVLRDGRRTLNRQQQLDIVETMIRDFRQLLVLKGHQVSDAPTASQPGFALRYQGQHFQLRFAEHLNSVDRSPRCDAEVIWTFDASEEVNATDSTVINLLAKKIRGKNGVFVETNREFLRKRGIRVLPGPWRYAGGLI